MSNNKKIVALLAAVGLAGFALLFFSGQSSSDVPGNPSSDTKHSLFANDPNFGGPSTESGGSKALFSRVMFAVLLVVVMGVATMYISKKLLGKITHISGKKIHVTETVHLGSRKTLHLIKIGSQQLLIGSTNERITKLADVTNALEYPSPAATSFEETDE